ncbi:peptidoglycan L-alanyl-D-glutamate endopeptidase CwlK [Gracilibacillus halophilus YIM-C55.5]|uniref:Peptidoglycan L-alanyl-D-glutamate endopeptidase CwlK n=1 Tax=Gracilibacillus halophilus YIM-C55.5 TaxID=1308866 RepID=N4WTH6_9BACI|nr:M15 family metallopeptidase [Gracilibacillus halophilus]ENH96451.1 peptidoglycan L-alanyl-D-glutamate endopeptidase CwlK [Gracilibacillus halophilus YIM-C55.5]
MKRHPILFIIIIVIASVLFYQWMLHQKYAERPMPTELHPKVGQATEKLIKQSEDIGISIIITDGLRSVEEQNAIYEQGRSQEGKIVTYAKGGESYHNYGLAVDFALEPSDGQVIWDTEYDGNSNGQSDWMEVVDIAKSLGFSWGGDFSRFKDYPHLQMDFGLSIRELQKGKRPKDVMD